MDKVRYYKPAVFNATESAKLFMDTVFQHNYPSVTKSLRSQKSGFRSPMSDK